MFGLGNLIGDVIESTAETIDDFIYDPLGTTAEIVLQPVVDAVDILDGLTEGEIRYKAALRLGTDVVAGMALSEVIESLD